MMTAPTLFVLLTFDREFKFVVAMREEVLLIVVIIADGEELILLCIVLYICYWFISRLLLHDLLSVRALETEEQQQNLYDE